MDNNQNNDLSLNESNNSNMDNNSSESLKTDLNKSNLSDFNNKTINHSSNDEKTLNEPKIDSNEENKMNNHTQNDNSFSLNENDASTILDNSATCEELHKDKVNIGETDFSKPKKKHTALYIILGIILIIALLIFISFKLIDNTSSIQSHFDDVDTLRNEYKNSNCDLNTTGCDDDKTLQSNVISALFKDMKINNDGTATINVSKGMIYTYASLDVLNNLDFIKDNDIIIKQIGYDLNTQDQNNKYINIYGDITYKGIKAGLTGQLYFGFDNDKLIIKFINAKIGNLPESLYKNSLPKEGQILYEKDISYSVGLANDISIKIFSPSEIKDISYDKNTGIISIVFNYSDALNNINNELFDDDNGDSKFSEILKYYLGISSDKLGEYINNANDYLKDNLGFDFSDFTDLFNSFGN